ncbi:hypothetical protein HYS93_04950 [Candidatus Daviesbacteria bacterium]|nr:hypothetical protein [Candidatus Daviesbacteria bacterium]
MTNLILIHGNGLTAILSKISSLKKNFDPLSVRIISKEEVEWDQAVINLSTNGLFSEKILAILDGFDEKIDLSKIPENQNLTLVIKITKPLTTTSSLVKQVLKLKGQVISLTEKDEVNIFPFLDKLSEKNPTALAELDKLLKEYGGQYLLAMLFYMFRRLLTPTKRLPEFIAKKINKQKQNFNQEKLRKLYKLAIETDFKIKTGLLEEKIGINLLVGKILTI